MSSPPPDRDRLLRAAERVAARLCRDAIWDGHRCAWVGPEEDFGPGGEWTLSYRATGPDLHGGTAGIALFLAHAHHATGDPLLRDAALGAAAHAASRLDAVAPRARIGLHQGWSGIALALAEVERVAAAPGASGPAREALVGLEPPTDAPIDVMGGAAGAIPALLRLGDEPLAALAVAEGERLLAAARRSDAGWSWPTVGAPDEPHLCGASHGASGIGVALLELWRHTGDDRFRTAGHGAFAYESSLFSREAGGWPDLRPWVTRDAPEGAFTTTWCHGTAGAALTRIRALQIDPSLGLRDEVAHAVTRCGEAARAGGDEGDATLCHGAAGIGEALLAGGAALGQSRHADAALALALSRVEAQERGLPLRSGLLCGAEAPGLMLGLAGFGLHLLRLCSPADVPCVLQPGIGLGATAAAARAAA